MSRLVQLSTLRDRVITLCDLPATLDTTTSPTAAQMLDLLQVSASMLGALVSEAPGSAFHFAESATLATVANVASVSLPTSAADILRVSWLRDSNSEELLSMASIEQMTDRPSYGWGYAMLPTYRVVGQTIEFYPTPGAAYSIKVYHSTGLYPSTISSYIWCMNGWDQWMAVQCSTLVRARQQRACPELNMMLAQLERSIRSGFKRDIFGIQTARDVRSSPSGIDQLSDPSRWGTS